MKLAVYDRERTICDCFKYKNKMDSELFVKAVTAYVNDEEKNLRNLAKYTKMLRVSTKVRNLMEVLIHA